MTFGNGSEQISQNLQNKQEFWIYPAKVPGIWVWEITNESLMLVIDPVLLSQTAAEIGGLQENDMELMNKVNCHPQIEAIACLLQTKLNENPDAESLPQVLIIYPLPQHHEFPLPTPHSVGGLSSHRLKQVITCVSGLQPDFTGKTIGIATNLKTSVAEIIQQSAPTAKVVEAFNITFAEVIAADSRNFGGDRPSIFYCGDDTAAKNVIAGLIEECGYEAIDAGNLVVARSLETLATAWVQFAVASKLFPNLGLKALQR